MTISAFFLLAIAVACAYTLKSITGFGTSLILVPALSFAFDIKDAIVIAALGDVLSSFILTYRDHSHLSIGKLKEAGFGMFFGTLIGVMILNMVNAVALKQALALFIIIYLIVQQINPKINIQTETSRKVLAYILGFVGGVCGGVFNTNGPALYVYVRSAFPSKEVIRANILFLFLIDSIWRTGLFAFNGMISLRVVETFVLLVLPTMLLGLYIGDKIDKKLKQEHYTTISKVVLILSGVKLLVK